MEDEFEALGAASYEHRGALSDEYIHAFRELWTSDAPAFEGGFYRFSGFAFDPKPVQQPLPIWIGGNTEASFRRVARVGDGWHALNLSIDQFTEGVSRIREHCGNLGRDFDGLSFSMMHAVKVDLEGGAVTGPKAARAYEANGSPFLLGTPPQLATTLEQYQDAGLQHLEAFFVPHNQPMTVANVAMAMEAFAAHVPPRLRA